MFGLERVSVDENFFDLGGHSLLLIQMHGQLQMTLNATFPIVAVFEHPTVRSLARHLAQPVVSSFQASERLRDRALRQKQAMADLRTKLRKT
jgi:hypothetical protein